MGYSCTPVLTVGIVYRTVSVVIAYRTVPSVGIVYRSLRSNSIRCITAFSASTNKEHLCSICTVQLLTRGPRRAARTDAPAVGDSGLSCHITVFSASTYKAHLCSISTVRLQTSGPPRTGRTNACAAGHSDLSCHITVFSASTYKAHLCSICTVGLLTSGPRRTARTDARAASRSDLSYCIQCQYIQGASYRPATCGMHVREGNSYINTDCPREAPTYITI